MISLRLLLAFALLAFAPDATAQTGASARAAEAGRLAGIARQESALGRHQSALSHYVRAIAGDPDNVTILSAAGRSEEHTSELQSLMRISYAVLCLKKKKKQ